MTDMITVSRKEIEALQKNFTKDGLTGNGDYINVSDLRALLDKAEVVSGEAVAWIQYVNLNGDNITRVHLLSETKHPKECHFVDGVTWDLLYTSPQTSRIAELEAEIARLNAIIEDIKMIDNVFVGRKAPYGLCPVCGGAGLSRERRPNGNDKCVNGHVYPSREAMKATNDK